MFANVAALHEQIITREGRAFVSRYIFDSIPFIFDNDLEAWIAWKSAFGARIDVDPRDIVITGSAGIGYSLNPYKNFKAFDYDSDVDLGVVSSHYFDLAWRYLRQRRVEWLSLRQAMRDAINAHRSNYVFSGTIAADKILHLLPFGNSWQDALDVMATTQPTVGREIRLRIYKDFDCLRSYQSETMRRARSLAVKANAAAEQVIPVENG